MQFFHKALFNGTLLIRIHFHVRREFIRLLSATRPKIIIGYGRNSSTSIRIPEAVDVLGQRNQIEDIPSEAT